MPRPENSLREYYSRFGVSLGDLSVAVVREWQIVSNPDSKTSEEFRRFDALVRKVLSVPHEEIMRREAEYKRQSALNPHRRGPKPKTKKTSDHAPNAL